MRAMRIGVIGVGAIGGPIAAALLHTRLPGEVIALGAGRSAEALRQGGLRVLGEQELQVAAPEHLGAALPKLEAPYDLLLLCTRTDGLEAALAGAAPLLAETGALVCIQNGLPEARAASIVGAARTLGGVVGWSSSLDRPGQFRVTSKGPLTLGSFAAAGEARLAQARLVLARAVPVRMTTNLPGARWSKLALNCAMSTIGTIAGLSLGQLAGNRLARLLALRVVGEAVVAAHRQGIRLEKVAGLDPAWVGERPGSSATDRLLRPVRHALIWAACQPHRKQRSGMLARLEAGRPAGQIDDLNGAVAAAAREQGGRAPLNERLTLLVHAIERGEERIGVHQLARVLEALVQ